MDRKGIFYISGLMIRTKTEQVSEMFGKMKFIPLSLRIVNTDAYEYTGYSPMFDKGENAGVYDIDFDKLELQKSQEENHFGNR